MVRRASIFHAIFGVLLALALCAVGIPRLAAAGARGTSRPVLVQRASSPGDACAVRSAPLEVHARRAPSPGGAPAGEVLAASGDGWLVPVRGSEAAPGPLAFVFPVSHVALPPPRSRGPPVLA